jgi:hypothetical protein
VEDHARNSPAGSAWWTLLAWLWAEQGRDADARATFDRLADRDFAVLERDTNWLAGMAELVEACAVLHDPERATSLYQHLAPFGGRVITAARAAQAYGPVDHFLGLAALTARQSSEARRHFSSALNMSRACGADAWAKNAGRRLSEIA